MLANLFAAIQDAHLEPQLTALQYQLQSHQQVIDDAGNLIIPASLNEWHLPKHPSLAINPATAQLTFTTKHHLSRDLALEELTLLSDVWQAGLTTNQFTWPYSMPPRLNLPDHLALVATDPLAFINRTTVALKFNPAVLQQLYTTYYQLEFASQADFNTAISRKIIDRLEMYQWFITYVLGNSPYAEAGFGLENTVGCRSLVAAIAQSQHAPAFVPSTNEAGVVDGVVFNAVEFDGSNLVGISTLTLDFLAIFTLFCATLANDDPTADDLAAAAELNAFVASEDASEATIAQAGAESIINALTNFVESMPFNAGWHTVILMLRQRFQHPDQTLAAGLARQAFNNSVLSYGRQQAADLKTEWADTKAILPSLADLIKPQQLTISQLVKSGQPFELMPNHTLVYNGETYPASLTWPENVGD